MTTSRSVRSTPSAWPSWTCHERAPKHSPWVEAPPGAPRTLRHGQIASQLQPSKYEPRTRQSIGTDGVAHMPAMSMPVVAWSPGASDGSIQIATPSPKAADADGDREPAARRQQLLGEDDRGEHDHGDDAHHAERDEQQHQRPAAGEAPGAVVEPDPGVGERSAQRGVAQQVAQAVSGTSADSGPSAGSSGRCRRPGTTRPRPPGPSPAHRRRAGRRRRRGRTRPARPPPTRRGSRRRAARRAAPGGRASSARTARPAA